MDLLNELKNIRDLFGLYSVFNSTDESFETALTRLNNVIAELSIEPQSKKVEEYMERKRKL